MKPRTSSLSTLQIVDIYVQPPIAQRKNVGSLFVLRFLQGKLTIDTFFPVKNQSVWKVKRIQGK